MGLLLKPPTECWQGALSGCLWASITILFFFHVKEKEERKKTITYTLLAQLTVESEQISSCSKWSPDIVLGGKNLSDGCFCLQCHFLWGQVLLSESSIRCCVKPPYQQLAGIFWCFLFYLFVNDFFCTLKQLRSVKFSISQKYNLLKLTYPVGESAILKGAAAHLLFSCSGRLLFRNAVIQASAFTE